MEHSEYLFEIFCRDILLANADEQLRPYLDEFDVLVGMGVSGTLMVGILATHLKVDMGIVRKDGVNSHTGRKIEVGNSDHNARWVFVDDFISSGETRSRVMRAMFDHGYRNYVGDYMAKGFLDLRRGDKYDSIPAREPIKNELRGKSPADVFLDDLSGVDFGREFVPSGIVRTEDFWQKFNNQYVEESISRSKPL